MKLRQLEFVVAIAREGSFRAAAERCNASQPTLSTALARIESELGGRLFRRTTRSVELTPFGSHMLPYLHAVLEARTELKAAAEAFRTPQRKLLRLGLSPLADMKKVALVLEPFRREHPEIDVFFKECLADDLSDRMDSGGVDIAAVPRNIVMERHKDMIFYADPLFYLPKDGETGALPDPLPVSAVPPVPVIMTAGGCGLNASLAALFASEGGDLTGYPGYAINYNVIEEWTWLGIGAGILPRAKLGAAGRTRIRLVDAEGAPAAFRFHWTWTREAEEMPHIRLFLDHLKTRAPALIAGADPAGPPQLRP